MRMRVLDRSGVRRASGPPRFIVSFYHDHAIVSVTSRPYRNRVV